MIAPVTLFRFLPIVETVGDFSVPYRMAQTLGAKMDSAVDGMAAAVGRAVGRFSRRTHHGGHHQFHQQHQHYQSRYRRAAERRFWQDINSY